MSDLRVFNFIIPDQFVEEKNLLCDCWAAGFRFNQVREYLEQDHNCTITEKQWDALVILYGEQFRQDMGPFPEERL